MTSSVIDTLGIAPAGFEALENVVVDAGDDAEVTLVNVYGDFTVNVTAVEDAEVTLTNTNATSVSVSVGETVVYDDTGAGGAIVDYLEIDVAEIIIGGGLHGNPNLVTLDVSGAGADVDLSGDLSSMTTIDLTGVTTQFIVDAEFADFAPAAGDYVTYLIGGTSSDWEVGVMGENGDSQITLAAARETVTFTEADFGTVVLNNFTTGADPATGDRIDLSQLGFTNNGQLTFEVGQYDEMTGEWIAGGDFSDVRITDLAGGPNMSGQIIVTGDVAGDDVLETGGGFDIADDLSQFNMTYV
jgi:hypothetical protein